MNFAVERESGRGVVNVWIPQGNNALILLITNMIKNVKWHMCNTLGN